MEPNDLSELEVSNERSIEHNHFNEIKELGKGITSIIIVILTIVPSIIAVYTWNTEITDYEAKKLLKEYGTAYEYALSYKKKYSNPGEENDENKRKEGMKNFKGILSNDLYKQVEESVFGPRNLYDDIDRCDYKKFSYVYNKDNGDPNIEIKDKSIVVDYPYIIKDIKLKNGDVKENKFYIKSCTFNISRRFPDIWNFKLVDKINHDEDIKH